LKNGKKKADFYCVSGKSNILQKADSCFFLKAGLFTLQQAMFVGA